MLFKSEGWLLLDRLESIKGGQAMLFYDQLPEFIKILLVYLVLSYAYAWKQSEMTVLRRLKWWIVIAVALLLILPLIHEWINYYQVTHPS